MKSYRFIGIITCILLVFCSVLSQTNPGISDLAQSRPDNKILLDRFELINRYLTGPNITPSTEINSPVTDSRICFIRASKSELWNGLVESYTYFTNIYLRRISIYFMERDLIFSYRAILATIYKLHDEPLLFLRI